MNVFWVTFESVGLLLGIGLVGFWVIAKKVVPIDILKVLSPVVLSVSLPCLVFTTIITRFDPIKNPTWYLMPIWWFGFAILLAILAIILRYLANTGIRKEFYVSLIYPNSTFLPLVIIPTLFGKDTTMLTDLFIFNMLSASFLFSTYFIFYKTQEKSKINFKKIFNGVLIGTLLAIILKVTETSVYVPNLVLRITESLGSLAIPLIMILIGGNISVDYQKREKIDIVSIIKFIFVKNILFPTITFFLLLWIRPPLNIAFLIFLISALPPVTAIPIFVQRVSGNASAASHFLIASFIFSLITVPIAIMLFNIYFKII
ncbi:MAG: AEC family transporter [Ignavibacteriales bacterium]|nr:AEC family transporter [Ignavibacteriales bacterium]